MREHLGFLKTSSTIVKIAAWIFLLLGILSGIYTILGRMPGKTPVDGMIVLVQSAVTFFVLYIIAKIAELLIKIINEIKKE